MMSGERRSMAWKNLVATRDWTAPVVKRSEALAILYREAEVLREERRAAAPLLLAVRAYAAHRLALGPTVVYPTLPKNILQLSPLRWASTEAGHVQFQAAKLWYRWSLDPIGLFQDLAGDQGVLLSGWFGHPYRVALATRGAYLGDDPTTASPMSLRDIKQDGPHRAFRWLMPYRHSVITRRLIEWWSNTPVTEAHNYGYPDQLDAYVGGRRHRAYERDGDGEYAGDGPETPPALAAWPWGSLAAKPRPVYSYLYRYGRDASMHPALGGNTTLPTPTNEKNSTRRLLATDAIEIGAAVVEQAIGAAIGTGVHRGISTWASRHLMLATEGSCTLPVLIMPSSARKALDRVLFGGRPFGQTVVLVALDRDRAPGDPVITRRLIEWWSNTPVTEAHNYGYPDQLDLNSTPVSDDSSFVLACVDASRVARLFRDRPDLDYAELSRLARMLAIAGWDDHFHRRSPFVSYPSYLGGDPQGRADCCVLRAAVQWNEDSSTLRANAHRTVEAVRWAAKAV